MWALGGERVSTLIQRDQKVALRLVLAYPQVLTYRRFCPQVASHLGAHSGKGS